MSCIEDIVDCISIEKKAPEVAFCNFHRLCEVKKMLTKLREQKGDVRSYERR